MGINLFHISELLSRLQRANLVLEVTSEVEIAAVGVVLVVEDLDHGKYLVNLSKLQLFLALAAHVVVTVLTVRVTALRRVHAIVLAVHTNLVRLVGKFWMVFSYS
jgi:hypothetical protein